MRRITMMALGFALLLSAVPLFSQTNASVEKALQAKEQAGWQGWKDHNPKAVEAMIPEDSINIADGTLEKGKQQILSGFAPPGCDVKSFSLSGFSYMWLNKDTVLMTYTATQDATCSGKQQAGKVIATSLWEKKGGKWISPFHQETDAEGM
ncbi:MAG TPA: nuclear transport factor 2 family protein [Acidobacteriaceae bacterium]|nr:nuclear transport factor 2 family protein [Acidobacteriaceae bacterium]